MRKKFFPKTIRSQLPLTYAGIAVLATSLIGLVLIFIINNYYVGLERVYLDGNASGISEDLSRISKEMEITEGDALSQYTEIYQNHARVTAFLVQARVRILSEDGNVLADSGTPTKAWYISVPRQEPPQDDPNLQSSESGPSVSFEPSSERPRPGGDLGPYSFRANSNMFGFLLQDNSLEEGKRSTLKSESAFYDQNGSPIGHVELSEGPEYGRNILRSVVKGWAIASLVALVVSIALGWLMSRRLTNPIVALEKATVQMKDGDLSIRAPRLEPDELASLSETFNKMAARIENNMNTLQNFVSDAAHEIRTPLTSLRADLNLALNEPDSQKSRAMVARSLEQVERLEQLSRDLLNLSKIETQGEEVPLQKIELADLLMKASEVHASAAEQAGIDFQVHFPEERLYVIGNETQLRCAVGNLLENAVKFTPAGGQVTLSLEREGSSADIIVEDTGIGVPIDERKLLFNRFHRGRYAHNYPGSGLGLAIARAVVEKHKGSIQLLPSMEATRFCITLPLSD